MAGPQQKELPIVFPLCGPSVPPQRPSSSMDDADDMDVDGRQGRDVRDDTLVQFFSSDSKDIARCCKSYSVQQLASLEGRSGEREEPATGSSTPQTPAVAAAHGNPLLHQTTLLQMMQPAAKAAADKAVACWCIASGARSAELPHLHVLCFTAACLQAHQKAQQAAPQPLGAAGLCVQQLAALGACAQQHSCRQGSRLAATCSCPASSGGRRGRGRGRGGMG